MRPRHTPYGTLLCILLGYVITLCPVYAQKTAPDDDWEDMYPPPPAKTPSKEKSSRPGKAADKSAQGKKKKSLSTPSAVTPAPPRISPVDSDDLHIGAHREKQRIQACPRCKERGFLYKCKRCNGTGNYAGGKHADSPPAGMLKPHQDPFKKVGNCEACQGRGYTGKCKACQGSGMITVTSQIIPVSATCPKCNGKGKLKQYSQFAKRQVSVMCRFCNGAGVIAQELELDSP